MSAKLKRQSRIKEILGEYTISNHDDLLTKLKGEGVNVTQATLSRDFNELGVIKSVSGNGIRYILNPEESGRQIAKLIGYEIISVEHNEILILLRTLAGRAQGVAHYIDRLNDREIMGTVGGDDTVLIIPNNTKNIKSIIDRVNKIMTEAL